jgi:hypothetical protein
MTTQDDGYHPPKTIAIRFAIFAVCAGSVLAASSLMMAQKPAPTLQAQATPAETQFTTMQLAAIGNEAMVLQVSETCHFMPGPNEPRIYSDAFSKSDDDTVGKAFLPAVRKERDVIRAGIAGVSDTQAFCAKAVADLGPLNLITGP